MEAKKVRNKGLATKVSSTFAASLNHASNWSTVLQLPHPHVETVCSFSVLLPVTIIVPRRKGLELKDHVAFIRVLLNPGFLVIV